MTQLSSHSARFPDSLQNNSGKVLFDPDEIRKAIDILKPRNELFEVRILKGYKTFSAYFRDADTLIKELPKVDLAGSNVYITLQKIHEGCEARLQWERFLDSKAYKFPTTSDNDILYYEFLPIDLDPVRPSEISSTDEELKAAEEAAAEVIPYMRINGWKDYIFACSGNGYHLLYPCQYTIQEKPQVEEVLETLDKLFSDDRCKIDTTLSNPGRIIKLYGTVAQKGRHTNTRPHRLSKILEVHNEDC